MKILQLFFLLLCCTFFYGQNSNTLQFEFKNENSDFKTLSSTAEFASLFDVQKEKHSLLSQNRPFNETTLNKQFENMNFKLLEKQIDYNNLMIQCGVLQPIESKDMMISAVKNYILNKYVLSLFVKTEYN